jgi:hypothetical protein
VGTLFLERGIPMQYLFFILYIIAGAGSSYIYANFITQAYKTYNALPVLLYTPISILILLGRLFLKVSFDLRSDSQPENRTKALILHIVVIVLLIQTYLWLGLRYPGAKLCILFLFVEELFATVFLLVRKNKAESITQK